mmetsp:Transcript_15066/g.31592  ORF Transcript_15066/g.31592 Transcript_15066/m.31592 type:complete len:216 (-) Transcript_15066:845-1492(-)
MALRWFPLTHAGQPPCRLIPKKSLRATIPSNTEGHLGRSDSCLRGGVGDLDWSWLRPTRHGLVDEYLLRWVLHRRGGVGLRIGGGGLGLLLRFHPRRLLCGRLLSLLRSQSFRRRRCLGRLLRSACLGLGLSFGSRGLLLQPQPLLLCRRRLLRRNSLFLSSLRRLLLLPDPLRLRHPGRRRSSLFCLSLRRQSCGLCRLSFGSGLRCHHVGVLC